MKIKEAIKLCKQNSQTLVNSRELVLWLEELQMRRRWDNEDKKSRLPFRAFQILNDA